MAELERALQSLAEEVDWPPTPPLAPRLEPRRSQRARALMIVLIAIAVAIGVAFSVPAARSEILRLFHLGGVTIEQISVLPPAQERPLAADLGPQVDSATAEAALGKPVRLPPLNGPPRLHLSGGVVSTLLATPQPVLLSEFRSGSFVLKKIASGASDVVPVTVGRAPGLWISGKQHVLITPQAPPRLAGNVLIWESGGITYRLEGHNLSQHDALHLARQITGT